MRTQSNELVVVDKEGSQQLIGTLSRGDIIAAYNRQVVEGPSPSGDNLQRFVGL